MGLGTGSTAIEEAIPMLKFILYAAGFLLLGLVFLFPLMILAGAVRVFLFHRLSKHRSMRMEPATALGLSKHQADGLLIGIGYVLLLGIYSFVFFHFF